MRVVMLIVLTLGIASQAAVAAELSTWSGSIGLVGERSRSHPSVKLALGASNARADFNGFTGAAHDPPTAKTTCWIGYRFLEKRGSWQYYRELGRPHLTAAGYVEDSPCLGANGQTLRVRMLSSRELSAQFNTDPFVMPEEFRASYAGRLHR